MSLIKHIPNSITLGNLLCGCLGIVLCLQGEITVAASLIWLAALLDFLDGFAARLLKVSSPIGKQLDSLADMVTFGVLPAIIMFQLLSTISGSLEYTHYIVFIIAICSALRLAKFNIDTDQGDAFVGLPTPANALFISAIPFIIIDSQYHYLQSSWLLIAVSIVFSLLLVSRLKLFALKFKDFSWQNNKTRYIFITMIIVCLTVFRLLGIPLVIILYILFSIANNTFEKK